MRLTVLSFAGVRVGVDPGDSEYCDRLAILLPLGVGVADFWPWDTGLLNGSFLPGVIGREDPID